MSEAIEQTGARYPLLAKRTSKRWLITAAVTTAIVALPVLSVLILALFPEENIWPHLLDTTLPRYLVTTLQLMAGVAFITLVIGLASAWAVTMCDFPGRKFFEWAMLLPFAVPAYVIAYVYTSLLDYAGPVQTAMRDWFGWHNAADYWFPEIRSLEGATLMIGLVLYPYVYLLARAAFLEQSPSLFAVSRSLGHSAISTFFRVVLPIARPAVAVGLSLVLMETLNDFGTVDFFAVQTLTAGLFDTWMNLGNLGGAAQIATTMLAFVVILVTLERYSRRKQQQFAARDNREPIRRFTLSRPRQWVCVAVCAVPVIFGFLLPAATLGHYAWEYFDESWNPDFVRNTLNSLFLSGTAALTTLIIGVTLAYSRRLHDTRGMRVMMRLSSLGYAMPGAVLAVGVIVPLAGFDNWVDGILRDNFGVSSGLLLSGTAFALVFAYTVRFLAVSAGSVESALQKITPSMDMASRSLGHTPGNTLLKVHLPMLRGTLITAALVVFVDCMKELPATLILRPFNFETLATYVYQFASDEKLAHSALPALIIVLAGIIPIILMSKSISDTRAIS
ncbi:MULTISPECIES: iron ABC transporter permease [Marinobacter]|jgi:iron(III) transport system permease protein|uniref:Iron(III) transport system permease protein n=3 Tax=Marinobacter TaxID=2742 RepID=A0ABY1FMR6_9GAMM|nr:MULTISPECIES: iron ABC transporter permease [Marinobacter]AZR43306.1 fe(3+)-transport system permease protein FbpB [Marinobacter salarius]KXJ42352.1 MAG: iron ABC transporter permease [Marinobacter sp. Hex_13]MAB50150.1 iron ABC transporter permease [Marinobacter sp.]MBJ7278238.1 iron ABC transporter permease [Marinobacter salarius]MBJ7302251.1 iron ABC transporter permease [Marinobacter salarius]|tara:strand:+ start:1734 stop:3416 length:1683 start_codon:yes stop_codon:yes gene_type:complete